MRSSCRRLQVFVIGYLQALVGRVSMILFWVATKYIRAGFGLGSFVESKGQSACNEGSEPTEVRLALEHLLSLS